MRLGIYQSTRDGCAIDEAVERIQRAERDGFDSVWVSQMDDYDAGGLLAAAGRATERVGLGTWIVPTHPVHPVALAQQMLTVQAACRNRLTLALGVSHRVIVERKLGLDFSRPIGHMREYLAILEPLLSGKAVSFAGKEFRVHAELQAAGAERPQLLVAALGPQMLRLAGAHADGSAIWLGDSHYLEHFALPRLRAAALMSMEGSAAKVFCTEMALRTTLSAMQVLGGQSYLMESDVQRWARMAMLGPIGMGTNNIQRVIIATSLGLT